MLAAGPDGRDDLSKLVSCCLSDLVKRPQTCGSGDVPKLLDLSQEVARIGDTLKWAWRPSVDLPLLRHGAAPCSGAHDKWNHKSSNLHTLPMHKMKARTGRGQPRSPDLLGRNARNAANSG